MPEQENALQQELLKPEFIINTILRRRWLLIIPFLLALVIGLYLAVTLPKIYEAQTLILVQPQKVPTNYVQSVVSADVSERINTISQEILSRSNLEKIISQHNLFSAPEQQGMFLEDKVAALRNNIAVQVTRGQRDTNSFSITFRGEDPELVETVTNALANYFIEENLKFRENQATGTSDFLEDQLEDMRERLVEQEAAVEEYRSRYMGELPEQLDANLRILDRLQEQLTASQENLRDARSRLVMLQNQANSGVLLAQGAGGAAAQPPDPLDPDALRAELARLQTRYTDKHPDIIKIKKQIEDLENNPASGTSDPALPREPLPITEVRREIQNISADINRIRSEISKYERRVESIPRREQELMALQRDYENLQTSYSSLLNRKLEAEISVNMERKQKGEQFRVIDRARQPKRPIEPNMQMLFTATIAAGIGVGVALIFLVEYLNSGFRSAKEAELVLGFPLIAFIPQIQNRKDRILRKLNWVATTFALLTGGLITALFAVVTFKGTETATSLFFKVSNILF